MDFYIHIKHVEQCLEHSKYLVSISYCYYNEDISPFYNLSAPHYHLLPAFHRQLVSSQGSEKAMKGLGVKYLIRCGQEYATRQKLLFYRLSVPLKGSKPWWCVLAYVIGRKEKYTIVEKERCMGIKKAKGVWVRERMGREKIRKEGRCYPQKG